MILGDDQELASLPASEAIPRLLEQHGGLIYRLGVKFCGSADEAEDLVQDVFLRAFQSWEQFEGRSKPTTWLYTIAARACQRRHRRRAGEPEHMASFEELLPGRGQVPDLRSAGDSSFDQLIRKETRLAVDAAIAKLPVPFRMALVLKDVAGLSIAEIAQILEVKEATVKTRVHRGRLLLRQELAGRFPGRPSVSSDQPTSVCLDLLRSKLDALDRGVGFRTDEDLCARCHAVFHQLDLAKDACAVLSQESLPEPVMARLKRRLRSLASSSDRPAVSGGNL